MTDEIPRLVAHGKLTVKPDIASLDGSRVLFKDGTAEKIDTIVFATGYRPVVPFMDESLIFAADGKPRLHRQRGAPRARRAVRGRPRAGQRQHVAAGRLPGPDDRQPHRRRRSASRNAPAGFATCWPSGANSARVSGVVASDRHRLEVNYYDYRRLLKRLMRRFGPVRKMKLEPRPRRQPAAPRKPRR